MTTAAYRSFTLAILIGCLGVSVSCCKDTDDRGSATPTPAANSQPSQPKAEPKPAPAPHAAASHDTSEPPSREAMRVQFGIMPGDYEDTEPGVLVGAITPGSSAEAAGIRENDRLMTWNGQEIKDIRAWMGFMVKANPGDVVDVGVKRNGAMVPTKVTLKARQD
jgi:predicted metalloprotease with PDZ domain